jgi:transposase
MPAKYGSYKTALRRLRRWEEMGVWDSIFKALASMRDLSRVSVDSTTVEAIYQHNQRSVLQCIDRWGKPINTHIIWIKSEA